MFTGSLQNTIIRITIQTNLNSGFLAVPLRSVSMTDTYSKNIHFGSTPKHTGKSTFFHGLLPHIVP